MESIKLLTRKRIIGNFVYVRKIVERRDSLDAKFCEREWK